MTTWIKLHRKFLDWEWFQDSKMVHLFVYLLLKANYKDKNWKGITIKRGQFVTGLNKLNTETGISIMSLRTCLKKLEKSKEINRQTNNQYSIITICKYEDYQQKEDNTNKQTNKQLTIKQQSINKQLTTTKERKKDKEKYKYNKFYDFELEQSNNDENYKQFIDALFWDNNLGVKLSSVLKMETQVNYTQFRKMFNLKKDLNIKITDVLEQMENWKDLKKRKTVYNTFVTFAKNMKK